MCEAAKADERVGLTIVKRCRVSSLDGSHQDVIDVIASIRALEWARFQGWNCIVAAMTDDARSRTSGRACSRCGLNGAGPERDHVLRPDFHQGGPNQGGGLIRIEHGSERGRDIRSVDSPSHETVWHTSTGKDDGHVGVVGPR